MRDPAPTHRFRRLPLIGLVLALPLVALAGCVTDSTPEGASSEGSKDGAPVAAPLVARLFGCEIHMGYLPLPWDRAEEAMPAGVAPAPWLGAPGLATFASIGYRCEAGPDAAPVQEMMGAYIVLPEPDYEDTDAFAHLVLATGLTDSRALFEAFWEKANVTPFLMGDKVTIETIEGSPLWDRSGHDTGRLGDRVIHLITVAAAEPVGEPATVMRFYVAEGGQIGGTFRLDIPARQQIQGGVADMYVEGAPGPVPLVNIGPGVTLHAWDLTGPLMWSDTPVGASGPSLG